MSARPDVYTGASAVAGPPRLQVLDMLVQAVVEPAVDEKVPTEVRDEPTPRGVPSPNFFSTFVRDSPNQIAPIELPSTISCLPGLAKPDTPPQRSADMAALV